MECRNFQRIFRRLSSFAICTSVRPTSRLLLNTYDASFKLPLSHQAFGINSKDPGMVFHDDMHKGSKETLLSFCSESTGAIANSETVILHKKFQEFDEKLEQQLEDYNPSLIPSHADNFAAYISDSKALQVLVMFGVQLYKIQKSYPETMEFIVKLELEKDILPKLQFLKEAGLTPQEFGCAISKNPYILDPKKDTSDMEEITRYLLSKKFTSLQIASLYVRFPTIFNIPIANLDGILGFYQRIPTNYENKQIIYNGSETRSMIIRCPTLLAAELEDVYLRVKLLEFSFGFTTSQIRQMLYQRPLILLQDLKQLEMLYRFYVLEMHLPLAQLTKNAFVFLVRQRLAETRHFYLKSIGKAQYNERKRGYLSLFQVLTLTNEEFCKQCEVGTVEDYHRFMKTL